MTAQLPFFEQWTTFASDAISVKVFPFATRRRRQRDFLVVRGSLDEGTQGLYLYVNPYADDSESRDAREEWNAVHLASLRNPTAISYADISKNGFNDVLVIDEKEPMSSTPGMSVGASAYWFENTGSDNCEWIRREIGRLPSTGILKVGHFTNNFALQALAVPLPQNSSLKSPQTKFQPPSLMMIYTQLPNVSTERPWFSNIALNGTFHLISDVQVLKSKDDIQGGLNKLLLASKEGITLVWWESGRWQTRSLTSAMASQIETQSRYGSIAIGYMEEGVAAYIACTEPREGSILSVLCRSSEIRNLSVQQANWTRYVIDDFTPAQATIVSISCKDLDGNGLDEILIQVQSYGDSLRNDVDGVWYYRPVDIVRGVFEKYKVVDGRISSFDVKDIRHSGKMDIITTPFLDQISPLNNSLKIHSNAFITPCILADLLDLGSAESLVLTVSDPATLPKFHELPLFKTFSYEFSLIILPPSQSYGLTPSSGLKVLYGHIEWYGKYGKLARRGLALPFRSDGLTQPLIIDARRVRGGSKGAMLLRIVLIESPGLPLEVDNLIPAPYPYHIRKAILKWQPVSDPSLANSKEYKFDAFRLRLGTKKSAELAHIHFTAFNHSSSKSVSNVSSAVNPGSQSEIHVLNKCRVRSCIVNGSGSGGVYVEGNVLDSTNTSYPLRPTSWIVPSMTEIAPLWRIDAIGKPVIVHGKIQYPRAISWLPTVEQSTIVPLLRLPQFGSSTKPRNDHGIDMVMDVDFSPFKLDKERREGVKWRIWCTVLSVVFLFVMAFLARTVEVQRATMQTFFQGVIL